MTTDEEKHDAKKRCDDEVNVGVSDNVKDGVKDGENDVSPCDGTSPLMLSESDEMPSCEEELLDLSYSLQSSLRKKRRRCQTACQRKAANLRERKRMRLLNQAFDRLKRHIPSTTDHSRLSRMQTLKAAIAYIEYLSSLT